MSLQLFTGRDIEPSQAQQTTVEEPELPEAVGWNQVQVCTWIGNQIMTQPSMFERGEVTKFVRSLGRNAKLRAMFPGPYTAAQMHDHYQAGVRAGMAQSQWQPIETAPKDGRSFDVWVKSTKNPDYGVRMTDVYYVQGVLCGSRPPNSSWGEYASHWMPLPAQPVMKGQQ